MRRTSRPGCGRTGSAAFRVFEKLPMPKFGPDLSELDLGDLMYYARPVEPVSRWEDLPEELKKTFQALGLPEAEQRALAGVGAQVDSEEVYRSLLESLRQKGVIFTSMEKAVREYPWIQEYFMKVIPPEDNKFAALHGAVWSGGTFIWVPEGVEVEIPLQAYYRIQTEGVGQFEHTLIIAEPGSSLHYIEGCSAPRYSRMSLHSGMVEIIAKEGARVRFTTIQNWSKNVYNLNNKRAWAYAGASVDWVSGSLGSKVTMLYPTTVLLGKGARTENLSFTFAQEGMWLDTGARAIHRAPDTSARLVSRSVVQGRAMSVFRGTVYVSPGSPRGKGPRGVLDPPPFPGGPTETIPVLQRRTTRWSLGTKPRWAAFPKSSSSTSCPGGWMSLRL
jgi:Fe-S cluster assembly protein SufB